MNNSDYADKFVFNVVVGGLIACSIVSNFDLLAAYIYSVHRATPRIALIMAIGMAVCVLFVVPFLYRQIRPDRPIFEDRESMRAAWRGRLVGMGIGVVAGIAIEGA
jgi:hypothetical protein